MSAEMVAIIGVAVSLIATLITVLSFANQKEKDAEARGALKERVDAFEKRVGQLEGKMEANSDEHNTAAVAIAKLDETIVYIKLRLDEIAAKLK